MTPHARRLVAAVPMLVLAVQALPAAAGTIRVPFDEPTLQAGIAAAVTGDTVLVAPGNYAGPGNRDLDFGGRDLVLLSEGGAAVTFINCEEAGRAIRFHSGETSAAVVEGFTIENGKTVGFGREFWGGGIACDDAAPTVVRCVFSGNTASIGGAIALVSLTGAAPAVRECSFTNNSASQQGAGIVCDGVQSTVSDCTFEGNIGLVQGGAVMCVGAETRATFAGCSFLNNSAGTGGGFLARDGQVQLTSCLFAGNTANSSGGGLLVFSEGRATLNGCVFHENSVGAIVLRAGAGHVAALSASNCTIAKNPSEGLVLEGDVTATLDNTIVAFNNPGAAVLCPDASSTITVRCSDIFGNAGGDWTTCIAGQAGIEGNLAADPLFCNPLLGDFHIAAGSPCAPAQSGACGLIGALDPIDCPPNSFEATTWGAIKARGRARQR